VLGETGLGRPHAPHAGLKKLRDLLTKASEHSTGYAAKKDKEDSYSNLHAPPHVQPDQH